MIGGSSVIEPYCFLGMNATIGHEITIGQGCFLGARSCVTKNALPGSVFIEADTPKFRLDAESFMKMTRMK
jgi:acetyltransferase-like isoleucine patch superfamily enzyme